MNPEPLFCDDEVDWFVDDADGFAAVPEVLPVFADVVEDADADPLVPLVPLVLSGKPPAKAFDVLTAKAPTTSDFNRWRIDCAPQKSQHLNDKTPLHFSTQMRVTHNGVTVHRITTR